MKLHATGTPAASESKNLFCTALRSRTSGPSKRHTAMSARTQPRRNFRFGRAPIMKNDIPSTPAFVAATSMDTRSAPSPSTTKHTSGASRAISAVRSTSWPTPLATPSVPANSTTRRDPSSLGNRGRHAPWSEDRAVAPVRDDSDLRGRDALCNDLGLHAGASATILRAEWYARRSRSRALRRSKGFCSVPTAIGTSGLHVANLEHERNSAKSGRNHSRYGDRQGCAGREDNVAAEAARPPRRAAVAIVRERQDAAQRTHRVVISNGQVVDVDPIDDRVSDTVANRIVISGHHRHLMTSIHQRLRHLVRPRPPRL